MPACREIFSVSKWNFKVNLFMYLFIKYSQAWDFKDVSEKIALLWAFYVPFFIKTSQTNFQWYGWPFAAWQSLIR